MMEKLEIISDALDLKYTSQDKKLDACQVRVDALELRAKRVDRIIYGIGAILLGETIGLVFAIISKLLGI